VQPTDRRVGVHAGRGAGRRGRGPRRPALGRGCAGAGAFLV